MTKLVKSDGNGGLWMPKWVAFVGTLLTLFAVVWAWATSYALKTSVEPLKEKVAEHDTRIKAIEISYTDHKVLEMEKFARLETKLDMLIAKTREDKK